MLSKKMTVSLMSLITILALAFVVPSAMAADDFDAKFSVVNTVYATDIEVTLTFGEVVGLANARMILNNGDATKDMLTVLVVDANGSIANISAGSAAPGDAIDSEDIMEKDSDPVTAGDQFNGKVFKFTSIPAASTTMSSRQIRLFLKKGVKVLDPNSDKSSKAGSKDIDLMAAIPVNTSRPMVVSIQRLRPG